jgi:hypothetical protein
MTIELSGTKVWVDAEESLKLKYGAEVHVNTEAPDTFRVTESPRHTSEGPLTDRFTLLIAVQLTGSVSRHPVTPSVTMTVNE